jgi:hypothetical protein
MFRDVRYRIVMTPTKERVRSFSIQPVVLYEATAHGEISHLVIEHRDTRRRTLHEQSRLRLDLFLQGGVFDHGADSADATAGIA